MNEPETHIASLDGLEIGATGPSALQVVFETDFGSLTVRMSADEARWLAYALQHWAAESEDITDRPLS